MLLRWESVLARLEKDPTECARELDWVAKLRLLEGFRQRENLAWDAARLQLIDLQWSDVRPEKGLYHRLAARGQVERIVDRRRDRARRRGAAGGHPRLLPRALPAPSTARTSRRRRGTR